MIKNQASAEPIKIDAIGYGFNLTTRLIQCKDTHELTHCFISLISDFPGVEQINSYEVMNQQAKKTTGLTESRELFFRRFPVSLDEKTIEDEDADLLNRLLSQSRSNIVRRKINGAEYILLNINHEVNSPRAILIRGRLNAYYTTMLEGLYSIYAAQTSLLDKKDRDALTHLLNRQSLDQILAQVMDHYRGAPEQPEERFGSWIALLDIDHFKKINDNYGHLFGDEVLIHFANIMKSQFRYSDFMFRYGGEEFLVILNQTNFEGAKTCLERFRNTVANHKFPSGRVTTSIGFTYLKFNSAVSLLLEQADKALYFAKDNGRNNTVGFDEMKELQNNSDGTDIELF